MATPPQFKEARRAAPLALQTLTPARVAPFRSPRRRPVEPYQAPRIGRPPTTVLPAVMVCTVCDASLRRPWRRCATCRGYRSRHGQDRPPDLLRRARVRRLRAMDEARLLAHCQQLLDVRRGPEPDWWQWAFPDDHPMAA